jgi:hypothetical protein
MAEPIAVGLRRLLVAPVDLAVFNDDIGVVPLPLDPDLPEAKQLRVHPAPGRRPL